ncbi:MAG: type IV pilin-like G/H family protein [Cyanobacteria bacterium P01_H01_bin.105]
MFQYFINKCASKRLCGFTLIETLITVSIIGLLSAIALPSFIGQSNRARETEAKLAVSSLKKSQYIFYLENSSFSESLEELDFFPHNTDNYFYIVQDHTRLNGRIHLALSKKKGMNSFGSVVHLKNGQLEECGLFPLEISLEHPHVEILRFIFDAIENYEQYCY